MKIKYGNYKGKAWSRAGWHKHLRKLNKHFAWKFVRELVNAVAKEEEEWQ